MTYEDIVYAAGFIDGEGTISIWKNKRPENRSGFRYSGVLEVYNSNRKVCEWFRDTFGGFVAQKNPGTDRTKPGYKWSANKRDLLSLLITLEPFLKIKREQAQIVIAFVSLLPPHKRTESFQFVYKALHEQTKDLNLRGINPKTLTTPKRDVWTDPAISLSNGGVSVEMLN